MWCGVQPVRMGVTRSRATTSRAVEVTDAVVRRGGVVRTFVLRDAGLSPVSVEAAIAAGRIFRVRRGWVASVDADPSLVGAAERGVVLSCVTQARRNGLWVYGREEAPHVAARSNSSRAHLAAAHVHWATPVVPRHPDALEDGIENVLALVATCQPHESALAIWESALRQRVVDVELLRRLNLAPAARRILEEADQFADSGLETFVVPRLRWLGLPLRRQIWLHGHRVDLLIGERIALQIDGGHHVGAQRAADIAHDADLMLRGYHVIRVTYVQVTEQWPEVQERIMLAVAQGLHLAR